MNKQPFYHRCDGALLFTASSPIREEEFITAVEKALEPLGLIKGSFEIEPINNNDGTLSSGWVEPQAGDPMDLM